MNNRLALLSCILCWVLIILRLLSLRAPENAPEIPPENAPEISPAIELPLPLPTEAEITGIDLALVTEWPAHPPRKRRR